MKDETITIQKTSKRLKGHIVFAVLMACIGMILLVSGTHGTPQAGVVGGIMLVAGLFWFIITRIRIWWHHG